jgi:hypothetical protein
MHKNKIDNKLMVKLTADPLSRADVAKFAEVDWVPHISSIKKS